MKLWSLLLALIASNAVAGNKASHLSELKEDLDVTLRRFLKEAEHVGERPIANAADSTLADLKRQLTEKQKKADAGDVTARKQLRSIDHQIRSRELALKRLDSLGFKEDEIPHILDGMADSDYGKLDEGIALLKGVPASPESDVLLGVLSGRFDEIPTESINKLGLDREKLKAAAAEILKAGGGKPMLPPNLSADKLRAWFQGAPPAAGGFHEMPGMIFAIKAFAKADGKNLSPEAFRVRILTNLDHNGPGVPKGLPNADKVFWSNNQFPMMNGGMSDEIREGFRQTRYWDESADAGKNADGTPRKGAITQPDVNNKYAAAHAIIDRLDQGTGGGWLKIRAEVSAFQHPAQTVDQMMNNNPVGTIAQLDRLKEIVNGNPANFPGLNMTEFNGMVARARSKVENYQAAARDRFELTYNAKGADGSELKDNFGGRLPDTVIFKNGAPDHRGTFRLRHTEIQVPKPNGKPGETMRAIKTEILDKSGQPLADQAEASRRLERLWEAQVEDLNKPEKIDPLNI